MHWSGRIGRRLKPRDLHIFIVVAEQRNMARAAEQLAISRPVVSKAISDLEHLLGVRLLDRTANGVEPTIFGEALLRRGLSVFDELRKGIEEIDFLSDPKSGELRIGCTEPIVAGLAAAAIAKHSRVYPNVRFTIQVGNREALLRFLHERRCELIIVRRGLDEADIEAIDLFQERLLVVTGRTNTWAGKRRVSLDDLVNEKWIQAPAEIEPGAPTYEAFKAIGQLVPQVTMLSQSHSLRLALLETGRFLTMMPASTLMFGPKIPFIKVLPIKIRPWREPTAILTLKGRLLSPVASHFVAGVTALCKKFARESVI